MDNSNADVEVSVSSGTYYPLLDGSQKINLVTFQPSSFKIFGPRFLGLSPLIDFKNREDIRFIRGYEMMGIPVTIRFVKIRKGF